MESILVLVLDYLPIKQADAVCMSRILNVLKHQYEIHVVTAGDEKRTINDSGIFVHGVSSGANIDQIILAKITNLSLRKIAKTMFRCVKGLYWPDFSIIYRRTLLRKCMELHEKLNFRAMICLSGSFTVQIVGCDMKKRFNSLKYISIQYDPYPEDSFIFAKNVNFVMQRRIARITNYYADYIAILITRLGEFQSKYGKICKKCFGVGLPLVEKMAFKPNYKKTDAIVMLFVGSMNLNVRSPEYWFRLISNSKYKNRICAVIVGAADEALRTMAKKYGIEDRCDLVNYVPRDELTKYYEIASILVSIVAIPGARLLPSKVLEYTAAGLPILSIEETADNVAASILDAYGNALRLNTNDEFSRNVNAFDEYIVASHGGIDFVEYAYKVKEYTPEWNAEKLTEIISGDIENEHVEY